ncbi:MAG: hypothetical protein KAR42_06940 [candidate division Zixibacteria bacterium]|nr:hypothetical protein [candidate division Zixibacteria bacterium]
MKKRFETVDLNRIKTIALKKRRSLASTTNLASVPSITGAKSFFDSLPGFLKANDLKALIESIIKARRKNKPVILMAGGHLIKVGLAPVVIDLMKNGLITGLCLNGSGIIHDSEIALIGQTSEDVAAGIGDGSFGMSAETASLYAEVVENAKENNIGLGQSTGMILEKKKAKFRSKSLLASCYRYELPAMIHIAVDTDIVCQHPGYDAGAAANASHHDFKILAREISRGENGGVFINIGSAVILPEVFLKALTVARNIYGKPMNIITANFDMITHYRPVTNVVQRPTIHGGKGYNFVGHHEIMIPLLAWGLKAFWKNRRTKK